MAGNAGKWSSERQTKNVFGKNPKIFHMTKDIFYFFKIILTLLLLREFSGKFPGIRKPFPGTLDSREQKKSGKLSTLI